MLGGAGVLPSTAFLGSGIKFYFPQPTERGISGTSPKYGLLEKRVKSRCLRGFPP